MKGSHAGKRDHEGEGPTEVNFKHVGSQKILRCSARELLSHFRNDGAAVECSTLVLILQIQLAIPHFQC